MSASYKPGTYVKGDQARVCETPRDAVAAVFEGFKLAEETPAEQVEIAPGDQDPTPTPDTESAGETSVGPEPGSVQPQGDEHSSLTGFLHG